jgi:alpha-galactosidase
MIGADLTRLDDFTLSLLTNDEVVAVDQSSSNNHELFRRDGFYGWVADVPGSTDKYLALFNTRAVPGQLRSDRARFDSPPVSRRTPGGGVKIDVEITGATKLFLVMDGDRGGSGGEDAAWSEPTLVTTNGSIRLVDLQWRSATSGRGSASVGHSASGKDLLLAGRPVAFGIGAHANSVIEYDLPVGATRFQSFAGLDGSGAGPRSDANVHFLVFTEVPYTTEASAGVTVKFSELGLKGAARVRDLWQNKDLGSFRDEFSPIISAHGAGLYRLYGN